MQGRLSILKKLAKAGGMKIVAIPKTIDNDVGSITTWSGSREYNINVWNEKHYDSPST